MDRFMLKDVLDYPTPAEETEIIRRIDAGVFSAEQKPAAAASLDAVIGVLERAAADGDVVLRQWRQLRPEEGVRT